MANLLVIDDDPAILHVFRRVFKEASFMLLTAESAAEGLAVVAEGRVDVVVLDVVLPDQSGLDVFRYTTGCGTHLPGITQISVK